MKAYISTRWIRRLRDWYNGPFTDRLLESPFFFASTAMAAGIILSGLIAAAVFFVEWIF